MPTLVRISQIETLAGQSTVLHDVDWNQFETILEDLGEKRRSRIAYLKGVLEIRMPLPEHERIKAILANFVKALLDELQIEFEPFGSTTFKDRAKLAGLEPDDCFYIKNQEVMRRVLRMSAIDPPPDLAIEVDLTSKTKFDTYQAIAVPELWIYSNGVLKIYLLTENTIGQITEQKYIESELSPIFGNLPVREMIPSLVELNLKEGRRIAMLRFKDWIVG
jgi:Uma2 family endonuclease